MESQKVVLCDTNILIELTKGNQTTLQELQIIGKANIATSAISASEFMYGAFNKVELAKIIKALRQIHVNQINEKISEMAMALVQQYALSHTLDVADSLIAATAIVQEMPLYTLNTKDFSFIPNISLYK